MIGDSGGLRLHVEHLRVEGIGPMVAERLAEKIRQRLEALVSAHGMPPPAVTGRALHLDGLRLEVDRGMGEDGVAAAIAVRLFEELYGPLPSWSRPPEWLPGVGPEKAAED